MKCYFKHFIVLVVLGGASFSYAAAETTIHTDGAEFKSSVQTSPTETSTSAPPTPPQRVASFFDQFFGLNPFTREHHTVGKQILEQILSTPPEKTEKQTQESAATRENKFTELVQKVVNFLPSSSELKAPQKQAEIVEALKVFSSSKDTSSEPVSRLVRELKTKGEVLDGKEAINKIKKQTDDDKKTAEQQAAKQKEQLEKQKQAEAVQKQLEQQAIQQALQQAGQNGGGSGGSGGGNSNSNRSQPPETPKFNNNNQPKHDLAEQLEKALNQKSNSPDLSSLFGNNNNNSNSSKDSDKEKKNEFKFDISPKKTIDEVKPVKASLGDGSKGSDNPIDPSNMNLSANPNEFLSGPTSVPELAPNNPSNPAFAGNDDGGGAGSGISGGIKGGAANFDNSGAQEIFQGVGKVDYGDIPPPIRKGVLDYGGGGGGGGEESYTYANNNGSSKKQPLVNELAFFSDKEKVKGKGLMAFVGFQFKEVCSKPNTVKAGFCKTSKLKTRGSVTFNK